MNNIIIYKIQHLKYFINKKKNNKINFIKT